MDTQMDTQMQRPTKLPMKIPSIMIVDDNDGDRLLAQLAIEDSGITDKIFFAEDGRAALDFLLDYDKNKNQEGEAFPPTAILLDINMPRMNGFEFLEEYDLLKKDPRYQCAVIMMLTSSENRQDIERSEKFSSVKSWVPKPISEEMLIELLS